MQVSSWIQLLLWLVGINWHNPWRDECTPDFSCCTKVRTPFGKRVWEVISKPFVVWNYNYQVKKLNKQYIGG